MAFSDPIPTFSSGNELINGVLWGSQWSDGTPANTRLSVYIAGVSGSETFDFGGDLVRAETFPEEVTAFRLALELFENVCNISFTDAASKADADLILGAVNNLDAGGNLGVAVPPGEDTGPIADQQGAVIVNYESYSTTDLSSLLQGGYDFISFIHELGHAVGLKHPHDRGDGTFPKFPGVNAAFDDYGDFKLNQGLFTMMSYNDGNPAGPLGLQLPEDHPEYGWEGTPMAFDIAALQELYGVNTTFHNGNDVYTLADVNAAGTFYSCIWDAGGTDRIEAGGDTDCSINLIAATLKLKPNGGGILSSHDGIFGGFTIANGVVIENASGGGGDDRLVGNNAANILDGNDGIDILKGGKGADTLKGGLGGDTFIYVLVQESRGTKFDVITDFDGNDIIDLSRIDGDANGSADKFHFIDTDAFSKTKGELRFEIDTKDSTTTIRGDTNGDGQADFKIVLDGEITLTGADFIL